MFEEQLIRSGSIYTSVTRPTSGSIILWPRGTSCMTHWNVCGDVCCWFARYDADCGNSSNAVPHRRNTVPNGRTKVADALGCIGCGYDFVKSQIIAQLL